jgi:hypothetical protein
MENDCAFANLEDKFKEKQKIYVEDVSFIFAESLVR